MKTTPRSYYADREFPALSDALQEPAKRAAKLGLHLEHYNSGVSSNPLNGTYIFHAPHKGGFQTGDHLAHVKGLRKLTAFLDGFTARRTS